MDKEFSNEYIKHIFTGNEKSEITIEMAQKVAELQSVEDNEKAVKSDFKSRIHLLRANVNSAAAKLNNGYEMQTVKCEIIPNWDKKVWNYMRVDTGLFIKEKPMTADDLQMKIEGDLGKTMDEDTRTNMANLVNLIMDRKGQTNREVQC